MARPPTPLPPYLRGRAFRVDERGDVPASRMQRRDLAAPTRGVRLPSETTDLGARCAAIGLVLPTSATFSHTTAAELFHLPVPRRGQSPHLHLTVPAKTRAPRRRGIVAHQRTLDDDEWMLHHGVRVTVPVRTFVDLAEILDVVDLVAIGDGMIARSSGVVSRGELEVATARRAGRPGSARAREALALLDDGSESPKESELRVLLVAAGFVPLRPNYRLHDGSGAFIARVDLALVNLRIAVEYEGDHHRDRAQWRRDIQRRRAIEALGWIYLPVTQGDLTSPSRLLADLRAAVASRG